MSCDHRGTQTVTEIVTTEDAGGDRIGDATRLSSCDGETVENEKVDVSKSLFFPIPGIVYVLLDIYDKVAKKPFNLQIIMLPFCYVYKYVYKYSVIHVYNL